MGSKRLDSGAPAAPRPAIAGRPGACRRLIRASLSLNRNVDDLRCKRRVPVTAVHVNVVLVPWQSPDLPGCDVDPNRIVILEHKHTVAAALPVCGQQQEFVLSTNEQPEPSVLVLVLGVG